MVHGERAALIDDLKDLADARWEEPSLCGEWTVHDVVAHLVDTARTTRLGFVVGLARVRFDFDRQNARGVKPARCITAGDAGAARSGGVAEADSSGAARQPARRGGRPR